MKKKISVLLISYFILFSNLLCQIAGNNQEYSTNFSSSTPPISVTIGGNFIVTGSFSAYSGERLDQFITRIYNEAKVGLLSSSKDEVTFKTLLNTFDKFPQRGIMLVKSSGEKKVIDLLRFRLSADFSNNPYLENDDVLIFPYVNLETNYFEITGAVNKPAKFQYVDGDKLSDAIFLARGIDESYENVTKAKIYRLSQDGLSEDVIDVNLSEDVELKRGDRIEVVGDVSFKKSYSVLVLGEVNNPGKIFVKKNGSELKDVIKRAGGLKNSASLTQSVLLRNNSVTNVLRKEYIKDQYESGEDIAFTEVQDMNKYLTNVEKLAMLRMSNFTEDDSLIFAIDNQFRMLDGIGNVNFENIKDTNSADAKFMVLDKDVIIIPKKVDQVYLFGQIPKRGYHTFIEGKDYKYYLEQAGGLGEFAEGDVYVINGKTREWINIEDNEKYIIQPGDYIYIPKAPARSFSFYLENIGRVAGILGSVATIALLIDQLSK